MSDIKDVTIKTTGGVITYLGTYWATLTLSDIQSYAVIFASIATGIYYLVAAWATYKTKKEKKDGKKS